MFRTHKFDHATHLIIKILFFSFVHKYYSNCLHKSSVVVNQDNFVQTCSTKINCVGRFTERIIPMIWTVTCILLTGSMVNLLKG